MASFLIKTAVLLSFVIRSVYACVQDEDCSLNGICTVGAVKGADGECACFPGWKGGTCGELNLAPARVPGAGGYFEENVSTWGGSLIEDENGGGWSMFISRIAGNCGLKAWRSNSEIIRATSPDPLGPYVYAETIRPFFSHGVTVRALNKSSYAMMHLGCGVPNEAFVSGCSTGTTPSSLLEQMEVCNQFNVSISYAGSLNGPWSPSSQVFIDHGSTDSSWWVGSGRGFSNPALDFGQQGGEVRLAFRADARSGGEHVSVAIAHGTSGLFIDERAEPAISHAAEDPFIWQDRRGHWHIIAHDMKGGVGGVVGLHAFSRDAITWTTSNVAPFSRRVSFEDGSVVNMRRRERPQLAFKQGEPSYFSTGVNDYGDHTFTLVVEVLP